MRPLHYAAWQGKHDPVTILLQWGSSANEPARNKDTPLHLACQHGHLDVVSRGWRGRGWMGKGWGVGEVGYGGVGDGGVGDGGVGDGGVGDGGVRDGPGRVGYVREGDGRVVNRKVRD